MSLTIPPRPSLAQPELSALCFSFQASSSCEAVGLAAELRTIGARVSQVSAPSPEVAGRRDWIVTLTTPPASLTLAVLQLWEGEMLAVQERWPGSRFLGWRTCQAPEATTCSTVETQQASTSSTAVTAHGDAAGTSQPRSQRELVTASLLRCPPADRPQTARTSCAPR